MRFLIVIFLCFTSCSAAKDSNPSLTKVQAENPDISGERLLFIEKVLKSAGAIVSYRAMIRDQKRVLIEHDEKWYTVRLGSSSPYRSGQDITYQIDMNSGEIRD